MKLIALKVKNTILRDQKKFSKASSKTSYTNTSANIYDAEKKRASNFAMGGDDGNTIELWLQRGDASGVAVGCSAPYRAARSVARRRRAGAGSRLRCKLYRTKVFFFCRLLQSRKRTVTLKKFGSFEVR